MKNNKIFRILGIAIVLALLVVAIPATPVQAAREIELDPDKGEIGDKITIVGEGFNKSTDTVDKYANIYFSSEEASTAHDIDDEVTTYKILREGVWLDEEGEFEKTFTVPDELDDGDDEEDVEPGTYYVYVTHYGSDRIRAVAEFTVIGGEITIDPDEGPVGTEVEISGEDFDRREDIFIEYDGDEIEIQSGDDETDRHGDFENTIIIPESTTGDHTITVTGEDSGNKLEAVFTVEPEITISPTSGGVETTVTVEGTGFGYKSDVTIYLNNTEVVTDRTDRYGSFDTTFNVPAMKSGTYDLEVWDEDDNSEMVEFTITVIPISANLNPSTGHIGTELTVTGTGYTTGGTVIIKYDTDQVATAPVKTDRTFSATFKVPTSRYGEHTITATDGTITKQFTFTMESTAPPIPAPLKPEEGIRAESQAYFDWRDVTDPSLPVSYTLQIAADEDFASIVLEKKDLTESEYTVTEAEKLESVSKKEPYYWRVKAIDGASNESEWSGTGSFYVGVGVAFTMPQWAIYTLFGVGALLFGALGFWLGRRTIYSSY